MSNVLGLVIGFGIKTTLWLRCSREKPLGKKMIEERGLNIMYFLFKNFSCVV